jgi:hypothetical protein
LFAQHSPRPATKRTGHSRCTRSTDKPILDPNGQPAHPPRDQINIPSRPDPTQLNPNLSPPYPDSWSRFQASPLLRRAPRDPRGQLRRGASQSPATSHRAFLLHVLLPLCRRRSGGVCMHLRRRRVDLAVTYCGCALQLLENQKGRLLQYSKSE